MNKIAINNIDTYEIADNLDLLGEACEEFGGNVDVLKSGAEACDVTIRCYLLGTAIDEVINENLEV